MKVVVDGSDLKLLCEQQRRAVKLLGVPCARRLRSRLADLDAALNPLELPAGRPHALKGDRKGQHAVSLHGGYRLVFEPLENSPPSKEDGGIDWARVTEIRIVYIGDYHE